MGGHETNSPVCKPGGHGAIWKLASDKAVFKWFSDHGRKGAIVRQVSNVVAATDLTLLALAGSGIHHGKNPEGSLLDIMRNAYDLLSQCNIKLPEIESNDKYMDSGPPYLILLHPALGVLWEVTRQKFNGGSISMVSELQIEVAEFLWKNVQLDGSLIILAENVMGSTRIDITGESILHYGHRCGRCKLHNVKVLNKGFDWGWGDNTYWKHEVQRFEALKIILHGNAEFEASDVTLQVRLMQERVPLFIIG